MFHDMMHREIEDYVDDIVVKSKKKEDHFAVLQKVFERYCLYKLKMNPLKCAFGVTAGKCLGFLVHQRGIDVDPTRASAIATIKPPTTHKELKSFLGEAILYKEAFHFVGPFECQLAFERVQDIMAKLPTVCAPIFRKPLRLYLASNNQAIGTLIAQEDSHGVEQPIYYVSCALKNAKTRYSGADRACLALIYASQEVDEVLMTDFADATWTLRFDGPFTAVSSGDGIVLFRDDGEVVPKYFKLDFLCSNNVAEYEAYLTGLAIAHEMRIKHLKVVKPITELLKKEFEESSLDEEDWRMPLKAKLMSLVAAADFKEIKDYTLISGELYCRYSTTNPQGGLSPQEISIKILCGRRNSIPERLPWRTTTVSQPIRIPNGHEGGSLTGALTWQMFCGPIGVRQRPTPWVLQGSDLEVDANICAEARMANLEGLDESKELTRLKSQRNYQKMANAYSKTLQVRIFAEGQLVLKEADFVKRGLPSPSKFAPN
uniref:Reverse transcriptase/retrotransposon-derived protein RNase H-like domain-containing protein n=1 Tax=Fagus sylvatica TaxID=28930 RepID=A0A2N9HW42_FAGSY